MHNKVPRYNIGNPEDEPELSLFRGQGGTSGGATNYNLEPAEWDSIMFYVLYNLTEVQPFLR